MIRAPTDHRDTAEESEPMLRFPHRRLPLTGVALILLLALGVTACGGSSDGTDTAGEDTAGEDLVRTAGSADCPARFGCGKTPVSFQVRNDSDTTIELYASDIINVRQADRLSLTMTVPARSISETKPVYLGDDGLESRNGYVRGGYRGSWTWEIRSTNSYTTARVLLAANEDFDFEVFDIFQGWSEIDQPVPTWESSYEPVTLRAADSTPTWQAVGSNIDSMDEGRPTMTWTFSPPGS